MKSLLMGALTLHPSYIITMVVPARIVAEGLIYILNLDVAMSKLAAKRRHICRL
ncbi:MAG TPA: hypothetical protein ACFYEK_01755 [Candidatus Wunengus sp. YC60]|uniref:hypothetical protein n=1 Tax=Candidatus Wunengus sp. YC60 TaxID=3367697 RepID=UPI004024B135